MRFGKNETGGFLLSNGLNEAKRLNPSIGLRAGSLERLELFIVSRASSSAL